MRRILTAAGVALVSIGQASAAEPAINADNCTPQPACQADYTEMETVTIPHKLVVNGHAYYKVTHVRRPVQKKSDD